MFFVWVLTWIAESAGNAFAQSVWHWYGHHLIITILLILFLG